jgi:hypothetical protein
MLSLETQTQQSSNVKKVAACVTVAAALAVAGVVVSTSSSDKKGAKLALVSIPEEFSGTFVNTHDDGHYKLEGKFHKFEHEDGDWQIDGFFVGTSAGAVRGDFRSNIIEWTLKDNYLIRDERHNRSGERVEIECVESAGMKHYGQAKDLFKNAVVAGDHPLEENIANKIANVCPEGSEVAHIADHDKQWLICGDYSAGNFEMNILGKYITMKATAVEGMVADIQFPDDFDLEENNCTAHDPIRPFMEYAVAGPEYEFRALKPKVEAGRWPYESENDVQMRNLGWKTSKRFPITEDPGDRPSYTKFDTSMPAWWTGHSSANSGPLYAPGVGWHATVHGTAGFGVGLGKDSDSIVTFADNGNANCPGAAAGASLNAWMKKCILIHGYANAGMNRWDSDATVRYPEMRDHLWGIWQYDAKGGMQNHEGCITTSTGSAGGSGGPSHNNNLGQGGPAPGQGQGPTVECANQPPMWDSASNPTNAGQGADKKDKKGSGSVWGWTNVHFAFWAQCWKWYMSDCDTCNRGNHNYNYHNELQDQIISTGYYTAVCTERLYLISHSFGGVGLQAAFMDGRIARGRIKWYQIQSSWYGSWAANFSIWTCHVARKILLTKVIVAVLIVGIIALLGAICTMSGGLAWGILWSFSSVIGGSLAQTKGTWFQEQTEESELCVKGWMMGKTGNDMNRLWPMPSNWSLNFMHWFNDGGVYDINRNINVRARAPNARYCGVYPRGYSNGFYSRGGFLKIIANLHLEHIKIVNRYRNPNGHHSHLPIWIHPDQLDDKTISTYVDYANTYYKWGNVDSSASLKWPNNYMQDSDWGHKNQPYSKGEKWSDGCVDGTNCMAFMRSRGVYSQFHNTEANLLANMFVTATNHDEGSCRGGHSADWWNPCFRMEEFTLWGGHRQFDENNAYSGGQGGGSAGPPIYAPEDNEGLHMPTRGEERAPEMEGLGGMPTRGEAEFEEKRYEEKRYEEKRYDDKFDASFEQFAEAEKSTRERAEVREK